jgi:GTP-binding protein Era
MPAGPRLFDEDEITHLSERFLAAELIREKLFRVLGDELPYAMAVDIARFETDGGLRRIYAEIIVDKDSQKPIVIGKNGEKLKTIASRARLDMEQLFGGKVFLEVWVKVKSGWADDERALRRLGYDA